MITRRTSIDRGPGSAGASSRAPESAREHLGVAAHQYRCEFDAELFLWEGNAAWTFLALPERDADEIADLFDGRARGFGSVRVEVTIGASTWRTSVFPDTARKTYVLPVKKAIRKAERVEAGGRAHVSLRTLDGSGTD